LDKQEFVTEAEAWAKEHPDLIPQETPALNVVNGEPLAAVEPAKKPKSKLIKLFK
jgi:hypothetical protein